jgi:anti-sigma regulatory factor (Ser/Thr protein kinase)
MATAASHHSLFAYGRDDALVDRIVPLLIDGVHEREAVVSVVDQRKRALLRQALGPYAERIDWIDRDTFYTRPEAVLAGYDAQVRRYIRDGFPRVRVFGEVPRCRTPAESDTWTLYEALVNPAFSQRPVTLICGLDARDQSDSMTAGLWETHPRMLDGDWSDNDHFDDPRTVVRARTPAPRDAPRFTQLPADIEARALRNRLFAEMAAAGVSELAAGELLIAVCEILANAHRHGGGVRSVRCGSSDGRFVCEVADHGPGLDDPLAGYLPPRPGRGAGLWVARQLTRELEMLSTERGLTMRLWI